MMIQEVLKELSSMAAVRVLGLPNLQVNILACDSFLDASRGQKSPSSETNVYILTKKKQ